MCLATFFVLHLDPAWRVRGGPQRPERQHVRNGRAPALQPSPCVHTPPGPSPQGPCRGCGCKGREALGSPFGTRKSESGWSKQWFGLGGCHSLV